MPKEIRLLSCIKTSFISYNEYWQLLTSSTIHSLPGICLWNFSAGKGILPLGFHTATLHSDCDYHQHCQSHLSGVSASVLILLRSQWPCVWSCDHSGYNPPLASHFTWSKCWSVAYNTLHDLHAAHRPSMINSLTSSIIPPLGHTAPATVTSCSLSLTSMLLPQGLCTHCSCFFGTLFSPYSLPLSLCSNVTCCPVWNSTSCPLS